MVQKSVNRSTGYAEIDSPDIRGLRDHFQHNPKKIIPILEFRVSCSLLRGKVALHRAILDVYRDNKWNYLKGHIMKGLGFDEGSEFRDGSL